jgi:hypothetical protein
MKLKNQHYICAGSRQIEYQRRGSNVTQKKRSRPITLQETMTMMTAANVTFVIDTTIYPSPTFSLT